MNYKGQAEKKLCSEGFDKYSLADITGISIPTGDNKAKMRAFLQTAGNPYLGVHVVFSGKNGDTLQKRIYHLLSNSI